MYVDASLTSRLNTEWRSFPDEDVAQFEAAYLAGCRTSTVMSHSDTVRWYVHVVHVRAMTSQFLILECNDITSSARQHEAKEASCRTPTSVLDQILGTFVCLYEPRPPCQLEGMHDAFLDVQMCSD